MTQSAWDHARWQRVTSLFQQALDMEPEQRRLLLGQLRENDSDAANSVEKMLAADAAFMTDTPPSALSIMTSAADPVLAAGTQLGAYVIESCIGAGGMGRVYRAHRSSGDVEQTVAIKCLRFSGGDAEFSRRFLRERQILASLNHPHIARFLDTGIDSSAQPFVVIEYIDGKSITEFARTHRLSLSARLELLIKVMNAVGYLHRQLIVHRDIKPGNVLVDSAGQPHLLDFGIAKPLAASVAVPAGESETAVENRIFSLGHAAPEQLRGSNIGIASDIYALGVLAYELLCDRPPLAIAGLSYAEAEREVLERFPMAPSSQVAMQATAPDATDPRIWSRALRGDLDNIILHALKKEPEARYPTADAFGEDLLRYLQSKPISLRVGQRFYRLQRFVARNRIPVALTITLVFALIAGGLGLWRQYLATGMERDTALVQRQRAEAVSSLLVSAFEAADPSRNRGAEVTAREVLDQAVRRIDTAGVDAATRVTLLTTISDVFRNLGLSDDSMAAAQGATALSQDVPAPLAARAWRALAQAQLDAGAIEAAAATLEDMAATPLMEAGIDATIEAIERERVAIDALIAHGHLPEASKRYEALYRRAKHELGATHPLTIRCGVAYAERLRHTLQPALSGALVLELLGNIPDPLRDPMGVRLLGDQARYERNLHQHDLAFAHATEHMRGVRLLYGERHTYYVRALDLMAKLEGDKGDFDSAIARIREMLKILDSISSKPETPSKALVLNNLANILRLSGRAAEAAPVARRSVAMAVATLPEGHINIAHYSNTLAESLIDLGDYAEALQHLDRSEAIFAAQRSPDEISVPRGHGQVLRAESLLGLNRKADAALALAHGWVGISTLDEQNPMRLRALMVRARLEAGSAR